MIVVATFGLCLLVITAIGALSTRVASNTPVDYLLAGRSLPPWLAAFSSAATNNSGYMFVGLVGYTYAQGLSAVWLQMGWILGDVLAWMFVHRRIRSTSEQVDAMSVPSWLGTTLSGVRVNATVRLTAALTFLFLSGYAAAQLKAGSIGLSVLFGWDESWGIFIGAFLVVVYCFSGGFRASVWTDAAQSFVMFGSMLVLLVFAWQEMGGFGQLWSNLASQDATLVQALPGEHLGAASLFVLGYVAGGAAALGQPHILTRTMAIRSDDEFTIARRFYFLWLVPFSIMTLMVGLFARALLPRLLSRMGAHGQVLTAEQALPVLSLELLPGALVGFLLAGLFSATMSTADSQVLSCSAAVTQDLFPRWEKSYWASKFATLLVGLLALSMALFATQGVFDLVLLAWSVLGASLGPLVILRAANIVVLPHVAALMVFFGLGVSFGWNRLGWGSSLYEVLPGALASFLVFALFRVLAGRQRTHALVREKIA